MPSKKHTPTSRRRPQTSSTSATAKTAGIAVGRDMVNARVTTNLHYHGPGATPPAPKTLTWPRLVSAATPFLRRMVPKWRQLPLASWMGDHDREKVQPLGLDAVYVSTATDQHRPATAAEVKAMQKGPGRAGVEGQGGKAITVPMTALEVLRDQRVCVVLGDPGAGKSAVVQYLAWNLATRALTGDKSQAPGLRDWNSKQAQSIPVVWVLRRFVKWVQAKAVPDPSKGTMLPEPGIDTLWHYLGEEELKADEKAALPWLRQAAERGWVTFLLDGIDEVPDDDLARFVRDCAADLATKYPQARVVGTCRTVPYRDKAGTRRWAGATAATLQRFDEERIETFVQRWFQAEQDLHQMPPEQSQTKASKLLGAIRDPHRVELLELASNPMLLTVMALLQSGTDELPENRVALYKQVTELLLHRWDAARIDDGKMTPTVMELIRKGGMDQPDLLRILWRVGWLAQCGARSGGRDGLGDVPRSVLHRVILDARAAAKDDYGWANDLVDAISVRSGLLVPVDEDLFQFPHRSFQEYLAAHYLLDRSKPEPRLRPNAPPPTPQEQLDAAVRDYPEGIEVLFDDSMYWREVLRWSVGITAHEKNNPLGALDLVDAFCPADVLRIHHASLRVWVAGEALHELRIEKARKYPRKADVVERVRTLLARLIENPPPTMDVGRRHLASIALGHVGDPRRGVAPPWPPTEAAPFLHWTDRIEPCPGFQMGGDPHAWHSPNPAVPWPIRHPFHLSAYPITNAQYDVFENLPEFAEAGGTRRRPFVPRFRVPNHPAVFVTWADAARFCAWLDDLFQRGMITPAQLGLPPDVTPGAWRILLPTEGQWELAARGPEGRWLPWLPRVPGQDVAPEPSPADLKGRCNWRGEKLEGTSAVGLFPESRSKPGALDLLGNVWEWTRSKGDWFSDSHEYQEDLASVTAADGKDTRVLRGGSWIDVVPGFLRCAVRLGNDPRDSYDCFGFRVVCVGVLASGG